VSAPGRVWGVIYRGARAEASMGVVGDHVLHRGRGHPLRRELSQMPEGEGEGDGGGAKGWRVCMEGRVVGGEGGRLRFRRDLFFWR
jgi:hypothetical protein